MSESSDRRAVIVAAACACAMIANQVAGKAARDAIFLANFDVTDLPTILIVASVISIFSVLLTAKAMTRWGPARLVPIAFAISAGLFIVEFVVIRISGRVVAIALYLQMAMFGAILISGFWSLVNERFDPRTAKKNVGRIAGGATLGGLLGGVAAERVAAYLTVDNILPVLAGLHALCGVLILFLREPQTASEASGAASQEEEEPVSGLQVLKSTPYLRDLATLVLLGTLATAAIDYVFKAEAAGTFQNGEDLLRFFATFYTVVGVVTFVVQTALNRFFLERFGLGVTVATLPAMIGIGAGASLLLPGLGAIVGARGAEATVRSSLFRSGYELLFTPTSPQDKRATKTIIDVGADRAGDALGGGMIRLVLLVAPLAATSILLVIAIILAGACLWMANRLRRGYVGALEKSLLNKAKVLDGLEIQDNTTRSTVLKTYGTLHVDAVLSGVMPAMPGGMATRADKPVTGRRLTGPLPADPLITRITELRCGELERVKSALVGSPLEPTLIPHVIPLLAWQEAAPLAVQALRPEANRHGGQLLDALLDQDEAFAVRRRIPRVLAATHSDLAVAGLLRGLRDKRFEVRFACGRALAHITARHPKVEIDSVEVFGAVLDEVKVDKRVWESRRILDQIEASEDDLIDEFLRERSSRSLEHVFNTLALVLPREPLQIAFRGLHTDDRVLRGTALEYLESVLPKQIRDPLWPFLEADTAPGGEQKAREEVLESLLRSNESIQINLEELRKKLGES